MVLGAQAPGRVGRRRLFCRRRAAASGLFVVLGRSRPRAASRASPGRASRSRRTRSATGGCVTNSAARPSLGERVDRVERLGRRARLELDELRRLLEADQRVREAVRRVAELGGERGRPRTRASARAAGGRTPRATGPSTKRNARWSKPPIRLTLDERRRDDHGRRSGRARRGCGRARARARARPRARPAGERREQPGADRERRAAAAPRPTTSARGKPSSSSVEPRLRDPGSRGEPLDRRVEQRAPRRARTRARRPSRARRGRRTSTRRPRRAATQKREQRRRRARRRAASRRRRRAAASSRDEQPGLEDVARDRDAHAAAVSLRRPRRRAVVLRSSSSSPRGGQSGSRRVAAARAVEATRRSGAGSRMCPFSSTCGDVLDEQYAVSTPSWYSPPKSATSTCSPLYLFV